MAAEKPIKLQIIRLPSRERHIIPSLPPSTPISQLQLLIEEKLSVPPTSQSLFNGFPPKEIDLDSDAKRARSLTDVGIKNGDTVEVRIRDPPPASSSSPSSFSIPADVPEMKQGKGWEYPPTVDKGSMGRHVVPSDNSCLFHSVAYTCSNKAQGAAAVAHVREVVANLVASDPAKYSTIFLGSPNALYQQHILNPDTWGGAIELSILSTHYQVEIVAFDYHYLREDVFGRGEGYKRRCFLLYTGDHYDAMVWQMQGGGEQVVFSTKDDNAWLSARSYVSSLHGEGARSGKWELQKDWRSGEGLKKKDSRAAEKERLRKAGELQAERKKEEEKARDDTKRSHTQLRASTPVAEAKMDDDVVEEGWKCGTCTLFNQRSAITCAACGAPSPWYNEEYFAPPPPSYKPPQTSTPSSTSTSKGSKSKSAKSSSSSSPSSSSFSTSSSSSSSASSSLSSSSRSSFPPSAPSPPSSASAGTFTDGLSGGAWTCPTCTFVNPKPTARCEMCHDANPNAPASAIDPLLDDDGVRAPIPQQEDQLIGGPLFDPSFLPLPPQSRSRFGSGAFAAPLPSRPVLNEAVLALAWTCPKCTAFCPEYSATCIACGEPHPMLFGDGGAQSRPPEPRGGWKNLFRGEERWACERCGSDNPPNLIRCGHCKAPNVHLLQRSRQQQENSNCSLM